MIYVGIIAKHVGITVFVLYCSIHLRPSEEDAWWLSLGLTLYLFGAIMLDVGKAIKK